MTEKEKNNEDFISKEFIVKNYLGFDANPGYEIITFIKSLDGKVEIENKGGKRVKATSLLKILSLGIHYNDKITIYCYGENQEKNLKEIEEFFKGIEVYPIEEIKENENNKINNIVENTAKEKIMTEEQKKKCEEIINSYKTKLGDIDIGLLMNPFSIIPLIHHQHRYDVKSIISMTISLAKVFNKDISEEEAKKIIFELKEGLKENRDDEKYKDFESMSWAIVDKLDDELILNLLILGKTGTGKSSIVNALVGEDVEETGAGKPKTKKGIFPHEEEIDGKKVVIHDSWGLEVGKDEEWEEIINNALKEKGIDKNIKDWFHSVTYCIQAGGDRIEDFDLKIIKKFLDDKYNVIVALTKSDQIGKAKREKFIKEIEKAIKIKIITYRALIKSNLINEVKKEFIKEIEKEIGEIEFEQIEETKSDMYPIAAARVPIFITAIPPINLKYDNIVKGLMKSNQIEQSKIEKFIKEIEKEIKETTKIGITVIPISANPEQLDHMTEKPKPYGLEEYKAAILISWREIFINRIPVHIVEKLKKDIEKAKFNAPRKGKDKELTNKIQEYFSNILNTNIQKYVRESIEKYYKINVDILAASKNIKLSNKELDSDFYSGVHFTEEVIDAFRYSTDSAEVIAAILVLVVTSPVVIPLAILENVIVKPIEFFYHLLKGRKEDIEYFIRRVSEEYIEKIGTEEFESEIRKIVINALNEIDKKIIKLN